MARYGGHERSRSATDMNHLADFEQSFFEPLTMDMTGNIQCLHSRDKQSQH